MIGVGQLLFVINRLRRSHTDRSVKPCRYATRTEPLELALLERWHTPQTGFRELTICCLQMWKPRSVKSLVAAMVDVEQEASTVPVRVRRTGYPGGSPLTGAA